MRKFLPEATGANGHSCEVEAKLEGLQARTAEGCRVTFSRSLDRVAVNADSDTDRACRTHCGTRAWFEGDFFREVPECRSDPVEAERRRFAGLYDRKKYREAAEVLSSLLNRCGRLLDLFRVEAPVRNDLAATYRQLSNNAACIGVLSPLRLAFVEDESITGRTFTPVDEGDGEELVRITRLNWKACGGEVPQGRGE